MGFWTEEDTEKRELLIDGLLYRGRHAVIGTLEGGTKTMLSCWVGSTVVCGKCTFDKIVVDGKVLPAMNARPGNVVIIDEESGKSDLEARLDRFAQGLGYKDRDSYPDYIINIIANTGFEFGRPNSAVMNRVALLQPEIIIFDSLLACSGGRSESDPRLGLALKSTISEIKERSPMSATWLNAHSPKGKVLSSWDVGDYQHAAMTDIIRGHGAIVGQSCDIGFGLCKISATPDPLRSVLVPKIRRDALATDPIYFELEEEEHGRGWARIRRIPPVLPNPTPELITLFSVIYPVTGTDVITLSDIHNLNLSELHKRDDTRLALRHLLNYKAIINIDNGYTFQRNPNFDQEMDENFKTKMFDGMNAIKKLEVPEQEDKEKNALTFSNGIYTWHPAKSKPSNAKAREAGFKFDGKNIWTWSMNDPAIAIKLIDYADEGAKKELLNWRNNTAPE